MTREKKQNILIIGNIHSSPSAKAFLSKFSRIISEVGNKVYIISGDEPLDIDKILWVRPVYKIRGTIIERIINMIRGQLDVLQKLITISNK